MDSHNNHKFLEVNPFVSPKDKSIKTICYKPIGIIHSPFKTPAEAPRQPELSGDVEGMVELFPDYVEAIDGIERYKEIVLVCHLHLVDKFTPKVVPHNSDGISRGVFSTRAPTRPNPLGISVVKLIKVEKTNLHVQGLDFIDGTPLLDIKPYYRMISKNSLKEEKSSNDMSI